MLTSELFTDIDAVVDSYSSAFYGAQEVIGTRAVEGVDAEDIAATIIARIFEANASDAPIEITGKSSAYFTQAGRNNARSAIRSRGVRRAIEEKNAAVLVTKVSVSLDGDNEFRRSAVLADEIMETLIATLGRRAIQKSGEANIRAALILVAMGGPSPSWKVYPQLYSAWRNFRRYLSMNPGLVILFANALRSHMDSDVNYSHLISEH